MALLTGNYEEKSIARGVVWLDGNYTVGASGAIASSDVEGNAFSFGDTATGRVTITFAEPYAKCLNFIVMQDSQGTETDSTWQIFTPYTVTNGVGTIVLSHVVAGSEADPANGEVVYFSFRMKAAND